MTSALYLIPGTMCNERLWLPLMGVLGGAVAPVHLQVPHAPDLDAIVDRLRAQLPATGAALAGFSLGAYLAAALAVRHPGAVSRLLLIANSPGPLGAAEVAQRADILRWVERNGYAGISRARAGQLVGEVPHRADIVDTILAMDAELGEATFVHQMRTTSQRADLTAPLAALQIPISLVFSRDDPLVDARWLARFGRACPRARLHALPGHGHMLPLEQPELLAARVREWLVA
jgi:pimeloyl-ACP methyl ester carboxylesterase